MRPHYASLDKKIKMDIQYTAELSASFMLSDSQLKTLWEACRLHYDHTVRGIVAQGGFLYGHCNSRKFAAEAAVATPFITLKIRELGLLAKALETTNTDEGFVLFGMMRITFYALDKKNHEINLLLNP